MMCKFLLFGNKLTHANTNTVDPDQLASLEAS